MVRCYACPRESLNLNFIAGMINVRDGIGTNTRLSSIELKSYQTWTIPPGSASVIETIFPEQGSYMGIDHDICHMLKGAAIDLVATRTSTNK